MYIVFAFYTSHYLFYLAGSYRIKYIIKIINNYRCYVDIVRFFPYYDLDWRENE